MQRTHVPAVSPFAESFGFSRAVRTGDQVFVAGTAAIGPDGRTVGVGDAGAQARRCFEVIEAALRDAGATLEDVVLTRVYAVRAEDIDAIAEAHGAVFGAVRPVSTAVLVAGLFDPDWLLEIEAHAVVGAARR